MFKHTFTPTRGTDTDWPCDAGESVLELRQVIELIERLQGELQFSKTRIEALSATNFVSKRAVYCDFCVELTRGAQSDATGAAIAAITAS